MPFTAATITASYVNADGTPAAGEVTFTLPQAISNESVTLAGGTTTTVHMDASGNMAQQLVSTQDADTFPQGIFWRVDERVNDSTRTFFIPVPSGGVSVTLESLSPFSGGPPRWG